MNSLSIGHETATDATVRASAGGDAPASSHDDLNPLWLIAAAMAIFFVVAAAILAAG